jgi:ribonuclease HI
MKDALFTIHSDGGARGNPGPAAYGFVVTDEENNHVYEENGYIGNTTNNVAEYTGVLKALTWIHSHSAPLKITVILDSELVARQLSGVYKVKNENLRGYYQAVKQLETKLGCTISYTSIPRSQNKKADALVNAALDARTSD